MLMAFLTQWLIVRSLKCVTEQIKFLQEMFGSEEIFGDGFLSWNQFLCKEDADEKAENMKRKASKQGKLEKVELRSFDELSEHERKFVPSPATGSVGTLTEPRF